MKVTRRPQEEATVEMTPLIDVVFLLLIFFMVSTTFIRETQLKIELPEASGELLEIDKDIIEVTVDRNGEYAVNDRLLVNTEMRTLVRALEEMKEIVRQSGDAEIVCIIRPHGNSRASSRIVVIHKASRKFVQYLEGELKTQPQLTSHRIDERQATKQFRRVRKTSEEPAKETRRYRRSARSRILIPGR